MSYELHNRPCSPWSLWGSVVEHQSAESESLRFKLFLIGTQNFFFSHTHDKTKTHLSLLHNRAPMVKTKMHRLHTATDLVILPFFFQFTNLPLIWLKESHVTWRVVTWQLIFPIASNMGNDSLRRQVTLALWKTTSEKFGDSFECNNGRRCHTSTFYF